MQKYSSKSYSPLVYILLFSLACNLPGCKPQNDPFLDLAIAKSNVLQVDDLNRAMELVFSDQSYEQNEFEEKVSRGLNRWAKRLADLPKSDELNAVRDDWQLEPKVAELVEKHKSLNVVDRTSGLSFLGSDAFFLRQSAWQNQLAKRICDSSPVSALELFRIAAGVEILNPKESSGETTLRIIKKLNPKLDDADASKLGESLKLFDWVVRNIQLETPVERTMEQIAAERLNDNPGDDPAAAGVKGLGYNHFAWQMLYIGRGDYVERAKLFLGMCKQRGIDGAMLQVAGRPWAACVLIADQLFVFDPQLGLPIPGKEPGTIATLDELRAEPSLLDNLDLNVDESTKENTKYWVKGAQLADVTALLLVSPESVSHRMKFLQDRLVSEFRIPLADSIEVQSEKFAKSANVKPVAWDIEFRTSQFRHALRDAIAQSNYDDSIMGKIVWYYQEEAYIDGFAPYRSARDLFVLGRFESERISNRLNAIESFYNLMYTDKEIDQLGLNKRMLTRIGVLRSENQTSAQYEERLRSVQGQMRLVRRDAGVFLSQSHFDNGSVGAAANWLLRIRDQDDSSRWSPTIQYLLGRSDEARREYAKAIQQYQSTDSPQFHGDLIRARMLRKLTGITGKP